MLHVFVLSRQCFLGVAVCVTKVAFHVCRVVVAVGH